MAAYRRVYDSRHLQAKCLRCFDAVGWAAGRASGLKKSEWWGAGLVICHERVADLHTIRYEMLF